MFLLASDTAAAGGIGIGFTLVYIVVIVVIMYFLAIRPQKKEQKKLNAMLAELAVGDACTGSNPRSINPEQMAKLLTCCFYDTEVDF